MPGGMVVFGGLGVTVYFGVFLGLTIFGPRHGYGFENMTKFNSLFAEKVPEITENFQRSLPEAYGDCQGLKAYRTRTGDQRTDAEHPCMGRGPLLNTSHLGLNIAARWITGIDTFEINSIIAEPPSKPPAKPPAKSAATAWMSQQHSSASKRWNFVVNGEFKNL